MRCLFFRYVSEQTYRYRDMLIKILCTITKGKVKIYKPAGM